MPDDLAVLAVNSVAEYAMEERAGTPCSAECAGCDAANLDKVLAESVSDLKVEPLVGSCTPRELARPGHRRSSTLGSAVTDDWNAAGRCEASSACLSCTLPPARASATAAEDEFRSESAPIVALADAPFSSITPVATRAQVTDIAEKQQLGELPSTHRSEPEYLAEVMWSQGSESFAHSKECDANAVVRRTTTSASDRRRRQRKGVGTESSNNSTRGIPLATREALSAHTAALDALLRVERACRRAQALAAADATPREQRRAWMDVNLHHRSAVNRAEHIRLWAAAYEPRAQDPEVAQGGAALPNYYAPIMLPTARRARRTHALERARVCVVYLVTRQRRMIHYLRLAANDAQPTTQRAHSASFA